MGGTCICTCMCIMYDTTCICMDTYIHTKYIHHTYIHTYIRVAARTRGWRTPLAHSHGHLCASPMRQTTFRSISLVRTPYAPRHVSSRPPSLLPSSLPSHPSDRPPFNFRYAPDMRQSTVGTSSARRRRGHKIDSQVDQKIATKKNLFVILSQQNNFPLA